MKISSLLTAIGLTVKNSNAKFFIQSKAFFPGEKPTRIDETIDLKNGFVISLFADAHA